MDSERYDDVYAFLHRAGGTFQDAAAQLDGRSGQFIAVDDQHEVIGYVAGCAARAGEPLINERVQAAHVGPYAVLEWVLVHPAARHRGVGQALVRQLVEFLIARRCAYLVAEVDGSFDDAQDFDNSDAFAPNGALEDRWRFFTMLGLARLHGAIAAGPLSTIQRTLAETALAD